MRLAHFWVAAVTSSAITALSLYRSGRTLADKGYPGQHRRDQGGVRPHQVREVTSRTARRLPILPESSEGARRGVVPPGERGAITMTGEREDAWHGLLPL